MRDVSSIFDTAPFIQHLGIKVAHQAEGVCDTLTPIRPEHLQQDGYVHAGVLATVADHTAGGAAATLLPETQGVLSIEFKINLLRPAKGDALFCHSTVLRGGRTISVTEAEVYVRSAGQQDRLVAKATVTLAIVPTQKEQRA